jgi:hypothetical protein
MLLVAAAAVVPIVTVAAAVRPGTVASGPVLPAPLRRLVQAIDNYIIWYRAPTRDGLRWIEVDDPRSRRADRLPADRR